MKKFVVDFIIPKDGSNLLWDVYDKAEIEAADEAAAVATVNAHCRQWGYNVPYINSVTAM